MNLKCLLSEKRTIIIKRWFDMMLEVYPSNSANFLKDQNSQFANPIGHTLSHSIEGTFAELLNDADFEKVSSLIDDIVRISAIQEIKPSQALSFFFVLKEVIRKELGKEISENRLESELAAFDVTIDTFALFSFDLYLKCREKLFELRTNETKRLTYRLLQKANLVYEVRDEPDFIQCNFKTASKMKRGN